MTENIKLDSTLTKVRNLDVLNTKSLIANPLKTKS